MLTVGKLWTVDTTFGVAVGLSQEVAIIYSDPSEAGKRNLFLDTGGFAKVNY
jgi:hypothetical protein